MIIDIEVYKNGDKWVVSWLDTAKKYQEMSEAFYSKRDAENKKIELEA